MSKADATVTISADTAGLKAALAEAQDAAKEHGAELVIGEAATVDAGLKSRKLWVGVVIGTLLILLASALMLVAMTRLGLSDLPPDAAALLVKFTPGYWLGGVIVGALFIAAHTGLIQLDKLIDLAREALPILKAKYTNGKAKV